MAEYGPRRPFSPFLKSRSIVCVMPCISLFSDLTTLTTKEGSMAHSPQLNPTTKPELNGKLHRYVTQTSCVRALRVDPEGERALKRIRQILSRPSSSTSPHSTPDYPSFSLIVRRSLKSYREFLETTTPWGVEAERGLVRCNSHLPTKN
jgi:hypothetical protein